MPVLQVNLVSLSLTFSLASYRGGRRQYNEGDHEAEEAAQEGKDVVQDGEQEEGGQGREMFPRGRGRGRGRGEVRERRRGYVPYPNFSIFLGNVPAESRTREIKEAVREVIDSKAKGVEIQRRASSGYAFLRFNNLSVDYADELVESLQGMRLNERDIVVERAHDRNQREREEEKCTLESQTSSTASASWASTRLTASWSSSCSSWRKWPLAPDDTMVQNSLIPQHLIVHESFLHFSTQLCV